MCGNSCEADIKIFCLFIDIWFCWSNYIVICFLIEVVAFVIDELPSLIHEHKYEVVCLYMILLPSSCTYTNLVCSQNTILSGHQSTI